MVVGVKYCGGCNPRYDRSGLVRRLEAACPGVRFQTVGKGDACDVLLAVCGCPSACADLSGITAGRTVVVTEGGAVEPWKKELDA